MAAYVKYEIFPENLVKVVYNFNNGGHTFKVCLTNTAPNVATHAVRADITEISAGNGYTTGGNTTTMTVTNASGTVTVSNADPATWSAAGGNIGPFRYAVLYDDTPTSPADPLVAYWDYGVSVTLVPGDTFKVDFGASLFTVA